MNADVERVSGFEELVGYRAWRIVGDRASKGHPRPFVRLESVTQSADSKGVDGIWPTNRWFEGRCLARPEHNLPGAGLPVESCRCGIYSAKSLQQLAGMSYGRYDGVADKVVGEVAYAGKVIEGTQGWKGERARIRRLWIPHVMWRYAAPLEDAYRVEVGFARLLGGEIVLDQDDEEVA